METGWQGGVRTHNPFEVRCFPTLNYSPESAFRGGHNPPARQRHLGYEVDLFTARNSHFQVKEQGFFVNIQRVIFPVQSLNHLFFQRYKNRPEKLAGAVCGDCRTSFLRADYTKTAIGFSISLVLLLVFPPQ